jgi:hypothetical protein
VSTLFPGTLDSFTLVPALTKLGDLVGARTHRQLHNDVADAVELLEAKVGASESSAQDAPLANTVLASLTNGKSKWMTIATAMLAANAVTVRPAVFVGTTAPTTTSATSVAFADPTMSITTQACELDILATMDASVSVAGAVLGLYVKLDTGSFTQIAEGAVGAANTERATLTGFWRFVSVAAGAHTVTLGWSTSAGTATSGTASRYLRVTEMRR